MLLSSDNKKVLKMEKLILNTINKGHESQHPPILYAPIDPKYLSSDTNVLNGSVDSFLPSGTDKNQFFGAGLEDLMNQRSDIIHSKIQMLISEIYNRYDLKDENLNQIGLDQCTCRNLIFLITDVYMDKKRIDLERKIIDLEQEKRKEKAGCFKDILFLKKELRESLIEKLEEKQKKDFFMNPKEELPCNI